MASVEDYAAVIRGRLDLDADDGFESLYLLARLYRTIVPFEQVKMASALAQVISSMDDLLSMADAIHLAYHLELFSKEMEWAIDRVRVNRMLEPTVQRELNNFDAFHPHRAPQGPVLV